MPLPFLASIPAVITVIKELPHTTTTVVTKGTVVVLDAMESLRAFFTHINKRKKEKGATEAKITDLLRNGDYVKINIALKKGNHIIEIIECEIEDKKHELYIGQTI